LVKKSTIYLETIQEWGDYEKMSRIVLVRHGETDWNREEIFRGRIDVKLNTTGLRQAEATGRSLEKIRIKVIYTSPLSRAKNTAEMIAQFQNSHIIDDEDFIDMHFGEWQGMSLREVRERYKDLYHTWKTEPQKVKFSGGESLKEVAERSMIALQRITERHSEDTVGIISHRVICKAMILCIMGLPLSRFWDVRQDTCAVNIFDYQNGRWIIELLNDTCHVKSLESERLLDF
jgi:broad specificity phosphatase PhoE